MNRNSKIILGVVVVIIIVSAVALAMHHSKMTASTSSSQPATTTPPASSTTTPSSSSTSTTNISITANDSSASQTDITVNKGAKVNLTFKVDSDGVYHGGLEFKSTDPAIDSGGIKPGDSKTISFVADKSFSFTPYWYESGVKKDYMINVNVQ